MVQFVKAKEEDAYNLARIKKMCWEQTYNNIYDAVDIENFDFDKHAEKFVSQVKSDHEQLYIIIYKGKQIDYFNFGTARHTPIDKYLNIPCVNSLYVLKEYQHKGIGSKALTFIMKELKETSKFMFLCCNSYNEKAKKFYTKMGGRITDEVKSESKYLSQIYFEFEL
jgi:ribosomal protein S18 acetylase RimI-like enzyme